MYAIIIAELSRLSAGIRSYHRRLEAIIRGAGAMIYDPDHHHRRSIRLKGYDYSQPGAYFITIVTQDRQCLFGDVVDGEMRLNDAGRMVCAEWESLPKRFPRVALDAFVIMPNHMHGIIVITDAPVVGGRGRPCACPDPK